MRKQKFPDFLKPFLWYYNLNKLDLNKNKEKIIFNILNFGTKKATDWLFSVYPKKEIKNFLKNNNFKNWQRKSYQFWKVIFNV
ncbi:MAG: hypothetical protein KatS3mg096_371 [Candidatus Parcubacteria bacterium]|nr:MAG: hypothetical protein KatS3mg096_371 [Candidatus Parcubacteria bacterium]